MKVTEHKIQATEVCRNCLGEGIVMQDGYDYGHGRKNDPKKSKCDICKGSGLVTVTKDIKITITPKINQNER